MDIKKIREKIDGVDQKILDLISERFNLLPDILKYKVDNNLPIQDKDREKEILRNKTKKALALGISPNFVRNLFKKILAESVRIQKENFKKSKNGKKK